MSDRPLILTFEIPPEGETYIHATRVLEKLYKIPLSRLEEAMPENQADLIVRLRMSCIQAGQRGGGRNYRQIGSFDRIAEVAKSMPGPAMSAEDIRSALECAEALGLLRFDGGLYVLQPMLLDQ
jgi:hypothetical protein